MRSGRRCARDCCRRSASPAATAGRRRAGARPGRRSTRRSAASSRITPTTVPRVRPGALAARRLGLHHRRARSPTAAPTSSATTPPPARARVLVAGARLVPPGADERRSTSTTTRGRPTAASCSSSPTRAKVWRQNTRGDYWVLDVASGTLAQLGGERAGLDADVREVLARRAPASPTCAPTTSTSSASTTAAITRLTDRRLGDDHQRHVRLGLRGGARRARRVPLEPGRPRASPTGSSTRTGVGIFTLINNTDSALSGRDARFRIPRPARPTPRCASASSPPTAATRRWMQTPGDPRDNYLARLEWQRRRHARHPAAEPAAEPARPAARRRPHRRSVARVFRDRVRRRGSTSSTTVRWIDDGRAFLWLSERDGWRHVYRVAARRRRRRRW